MTFTGGPLNKLNGKCGSSDPNKSVHVMSLIRNHDPETPDELYEEINRHYHEDCSCGVSSGGTVEDFGDWLYEAQFEHWGEERFDRETCRTWEYDLFVMQSLKGHTIETDAKSEFESGGFSVADSTHVGDNEYYVDFVVMNGDQPLAGIQVKPESYRNVRGNIHARDRASHDEIDEPIYYVYYDYDTESFSNIERIMDEVDELVNDD